MHLKRPPSSVALGALVVFFAATTLWLAIDKVSTEAELSRRSRPPERSVLSEAVELRVLTEKLVIQADVRPDWSLALSQHGIVPNADAIVTRAPLPVGHALEEGVLLYEVAGRPTFAAIGALPSYRDLRLGDSGGDVEELQAFFSRIGLRVNDPRGHLGASTEAAIRRFYERAGYRAVLESASDGTSTNAILPKGEIAYLPSVEAQVDQVRRNLGQLADNAILSVTSLRSSIRATIPSDEISVVLPGARAKLSIPGRSDLYGTVTDISPETIDDQTGARSSEVTIRVRDDLTQALVSEGVTATIDGRSTGTPALVVPLAAVFGRADGSAYVLRLRHETRTPITVKPGLSANGFVAISAEGDLAATDRVVTSQ